MLYDNVNTNTNTTNLNANPNTMTSALQTMSKDARNKLDQRLPERAAAAKNKSSSSSYIKLKDGKLQGDIYR